MKVLCVSEYYPPKTFGGGEIGAKVLAENLAEYNEVVVLTSHFPGLKEIEKKNKVKITRKLKTAPPGSLINEVKRVKLLKKSMERALPKILKEEKPDVIHCLNTSSIEAVSNIKTEIPKIATINSYRNVCPKANLFYNEKEECTGAEFKKCVHCLLISEYFGKVKVNPFLKPLLIPLVYKQYERRNQSLEGIDRFIAISSFVKEALLNANVPGRKIIEIPNPIEINKISKREIKFPENKINITSLSALEKIKGIDTLIATISKVKNDEIMLNIVGTGSQEENLKNLAERLDIADKVNFLGQIQYKEIPSIYERSDIIAIFSKWPEPLPRVGIESLYFGRPIIATDVGGNKDLVENGKNGFLVNVRRNDPREKLEKLIRDDELRRRMGEKSRKLFEKKFEKKKIIKSITKVYRK